jgi:hypothetical protein
MANSRAPMKKYWLEEKEKIAEARKAWKKLLAVRDGMVLERKTIASPDVPIEVDVVPSARDLIKCCEVILDRAVGKPAQAVDLTSRGERFVNITNTFDANSEWRAAREAKQKQQQEQQEELFGDSPNETKG